MTGVKISHNQIRLLCESEAEVVETEQQQTYDELENQALVETMESLVDYLSEGDPTNGLTDDLLDGKACKTSPLFSDSCQTDRFYMSLDGVFIDGIAKDKHLEAKVGIVFTDKVAQLHKGHNWLLNKQYVGTFGNSQQLGHQLFCCGRQMGLDDSTPFCILGDGAEWIRKLAKTQYPKAQLILDWWHLKRRGWETVDFLKRTVLTEEIAVEWGRQLISLLWHGKPTEALRKMVLLSQQLGVDLHPPIGDLHPSWGNRIRTLSLGTRPAGMYLTQERAAYWDGRSNTGESVSSSVYFYHFQAGDPSGGPNPSGGKEDLAQNLTHFAATKKMLILK